MEPEQKYPRLKHFVTPIVVSLVIFLVMLSGPELQTWLRYDRINITNGQFWRIFTAHFAHLGWPHMTMNLIGLWLCWVIFRQQLAPLASLTLIILSAVGISLMLVLFNPELDWYVGLSGVLHALFISGCLLEITSGRKEFYMLLGLIIAKLAWEQLAGPLPGSEDTAGGNVIVDAHLYGACLGLLITGGYIGIQKAMESSTL